MRVESTLDAKDPGKQSMKKTPQEAQVRKPCGEVYLKCEQDFNRTVFPSSAEFDLNQSLAFVAGCLLVAVGKICGVIIYKPKPPGSNVILY